MTKLVRDKIPEIIKNKNQTCEIKIIQNDSEYLSALHEKLLEEVNEFIEASVKNDRSQEVEEMADILEVIEAIYALKKYDAELIQEKKQKKKLERGGFKKRIVLTIKD